MNRMDSNRVAQTSKSAVSRVSKPACLTQFNAHWNIGYPADLEVGDTAGWETCATTSRAANGGGR